LTVLKVKGSKVQEYEVLCAVCECFVGSDDEVYIVGKQVFHEIWLNYSHNRSESLRILLK
jgi:hypothetical protein